MKEFENDSFKFTAHMKRKTLLMYYVCVHSWEYALQFLKNHDAADLGVTSFAAMPPAPRATFKPQYNGHNSFRDTGTRVPPSPIATANTFCSESVNSKVSSLRVVDSLKLLVKEHFCSLSNFRSFLCTNNLIYADLLLTEDNLGGIFGSLLLDWLAEQLPDDLRDIVLDPFNSVHEWSFTNLSNAYR